MSWHFQFVLKWCRDFRVAWDILVVVVCISQEGSHGGDGPGDGELFEQQKTPRSNTPLAIFEDMAAKFHLLGEHSAIFEVEDPLPFLESIQGLAQILVMLSEEFFILGLCGI